MNPRVTGYEAKLKLATEMVLSKALIAWKIERVMKRIDESLVSGDQEEFKRCSEELGRLKDAAL